MARIRSQASHAVDVSRGNARACSEALTLDTLRAMRGLGFSRAELAEALQADAGTVEQLASGELRVDPGSDTGERALLLVRLHRALGDVYGSLEQVHGWLETEDPILNARPHDLIRTQAGLRRVVGYMETRCKDCLW